MNGACPVQKIPFLYIKSLGRFSLVRFLASLTVLFFFSFFLSGESTVLSFVSWLTLSGTEQSSLRGPSTENQEAKKMALECIKVIYSVALIKGIVHPSHRGSMSLGLCSLSVCKWLKHFVFLFTASFFALLAL